MLRYFTFNLQFSLAVTALLQLLAISSIHSNRAREIGMFITLKSSGRGDGEADMVQVATKSAGTGRRQVNRKSACHSCQMSNVGLALQSDAEERYSNTNEWLSR